MPSGNCACPRDSRLDPVCALNRIGDIDELVLKAEARGERQFEFLRKLGVIADLRMRVERQIKREQIEVGLEQQREAAPARSSTCSPFGQ